MPKRARSLAGSCHSGQRRLVDMVELPGPGGGIVDGDVQRSSISISLPSTETDTVISFLSRGVSPRSRT